jgi:23S rRNA pseudouridine1911/1915/1917 synthase
VDEARVEQIVTLEVPSGYEEAARLDRYITRFLPNVSRSKVQRGIEEGCVTVNGVPIVKSSYSVQAGDVIVCTLMRPPPIEAAPEPIPVDVVYEDEDLLVVNKAAGMVVHPAYGHRTGTLVNALLHHVGAGVVDVDSDEDAIDDDELGLSTMNAVPAREGDPAIRPGIVHRLDKDTSGLLVVAKHDAAHGALARQFADHSIERRYLALLWGVPQPRTGRIATDIGRDPRNRKRMAVVPPGEGKRAVSHYDVVEPFEYTSLVAFHLETGRTHQIRVHAQHVDHPILGDATYGGKSIRYGSASSSRKAFFRNIFERLDRHALHAETLGFVHPRSGEPVSFQADPPDDMHAAIQRLRSVEGPAQGKSGY